MSASVSWPAVNCAVTVVNTPVFGVRTSGGTELYQIGIASYSAIRAFMVGVENFTMNVLAFPTGVYSTTTAGQQSVVFSGTQNVLSYPTGVYSTTGGPFTVVQNATARTLTGTASTSSIGPQSVVFSGTHNVLAYPTGVTSTTSTGPLLAMVYDGTSRITSLHPCIRVRPANTTINLLLTNTSRILTGVSGSYTFLCGLFLFAAGTVNVGIIEGTGNTCASNISGLIGGTTAATGPNLTAQTGFVLPFAIATSRTNMDFCLISSATIQLSGVVTWVQTP